MKQLSLNNLGVQELDAKEMQKIDGGIVGWALALGIIAGVTVVNLAINKWGNKDCPEGEESNQ
ncbi:MAG: class IIb bacteriocin, lactobin A/cerein 7B family [Tenuifilaceae bacterium]|jgi:lactobin A/cerein 7B family class IIb bacteriocin|nr:class IIb bacteriocin, lactobin A/cerein 7B family [Tenuifilaceae bacterium]